MVDDDATPEIEEMMVQRDDRGPKLMNKKFGKAIPVRRPITIQDFVPTPTRNKLAQLEVQEAWGGTNHPDPDVSKPSSNQSIDTDKARSNVPRPSGTSQHDCPDAFEV